MTPPDILYKYVGCEVHHLHILSELHIRFTQPDDLNDPFDFIPALLPPVDVEQFVDDTIARNRAAINLAGLNPEQIYSARDILISSYTQNPDELLKRFTQIVKENFNELGVLSLAARNDNLPMWAHYANNHSGFVIGFRTDCSPLAKRSTDQITEGELRPVIYRVGRVSSPCDPFTLDPDILFIKLDDWSYEEEWRIVRRLSSCDRVLNDLAGEPRYYQCKIDPSAIVQINIGMNMAPAIRNQLIALTAPGTPLENVMLFQSELTPGGGSIRFHSMGNP